MQVCIKSFKQLTTSELYSILKLRVDVFVVEQSCPYPDLDGRDQEAIHVYLEEAGRIVAYLRIMDRGVESDNVSIGRVLTSIRGKGLGKKIMEEGIRAAKETFKADKIYIEAQTYAKKFYEKLGFEQTSEEFVLDGIPHVKMLL